MSPRYLIFILLGLLVGLLPACSDDPTSPVKDPEPELFSVPDSVPHDFVVTTEPSPVVSGEAFDVTVRWVDLNMNMSGIGMELEGAHAIGWWTVDWDPGFTRYTCSRRMMAPTEFNTNLLYISVGDPDSSVIHVHEVEVAGDFGPPENTVPYNFNAFFYPARITSGQTVSLVLQGYDDENNMVAGLTVTHADGTPVVPHTGTPRFFFNLDAHVFSFRMDFTAPDEPGRYDLGFAVGDMEGETYGWSATFEVETPNQAPFFTEIWLEDRILEGNSDVLNFRVAAIDPDGDYLGLASETIYGSLEFDLFGAASGDTTIWSGTFIPSYADTATITFGVNDGNVEVPSDTYYIVVDHSGRPILDEYFVVDGAGVTTWYDPAHNAYLEAYSGEPFIFEISAHDPQGDVLTYEWFMSIDGSLSSQTSDESVFRCSMPAYASLVDVFCDVSDSNGNNIAVRPTRIAVF